MPAARTSTTPIIAAGILVLLLAISVLCPAGLTFVQLVGGVASGGFVWADAIPEGQLLARTGGAVLLIAVLATLLAWPAAWAARLWKWQHLLIVLAPMLLPSYLAYSGWGMLRAPGTWLGNIILTGPAGVQNAGENWWPLAAARVQAVLGLTLWAWPLAAAVLVAHLRRLDQSVLESLKLEPIGRIRHLLTILSMTRRGMLTALGAVALVMLGSAIPLHVAQFETYSIVIWRRMTEVPHSEQWRVWIAAWPLLAVAGAAAIIITRRISTVDQASAPRQAARIGAWRKIPPGPTLFAAGLWSLSIIAPAVLFMTSLRSTQPLVRFWTLSWEPLTASAGIAATVAAIAVVMIVCAWLAAAGGEISRRIAIAAAGIFAAAGLVPGVLVGAAMARWWTLMGDWLPPARSLADSPVILVIAHVGRFGFIAALAGIFLAAIEPRNLRDLRLLDTGTSLRGFVRAALPPQLGVVLSTGIGVGLLSFHEIEAAVLLHPPSAVGGNLPWQMLQWLHFARMDDLSAAVMWVLAVAAVAFGLLLAAAHVGNRLGTKSRGRRG